MSQFELKVLSIAGNGAVEKYSVSADQERIDSVLECARLCSDSCKAWKVDDLTYCVVYLPVEETEVIFNES
jgi:hypothetical protein